MTVGVFFSDTNPRRGTRNEKKIHLDGISEFFSMYVPSTIYLFRVSWRYIKCNKYATKSKSARHRKHNQSTKWSLIRKLIPCYLLLSITMNFDPLTKERTKRKISNDRNITLDIFHWSSILHSASTPIGPLSTMPRRNPPPPAPAAPSLFLFSTPEAA